MELAALNTSCKKENVSEIHLEILTHLRHYFSLPLCLIFVEDGHLVPKPGQSQCHTAIIRDILGIIKHLAKSFGFYWHSVRFPYRNLTLTLTILLH